MPCKVKSYISFLKQFYEPSNDLVKQIVNANALQQYTVVCDLDIESIGTCTICHNPIGTIGILRCGHTFCYNCIEEWASKEYSCPLCRATTWSSAHLVGLPVYKCDQHETYGCEKYRAITSHFDRNKILFCAEARMELDQGWG